MELIQLVKFFRRQGLVNPHFDCFIEPGEPEEEETAFHAGLVGTGTVCHMHSHRCQSRVLSKSYLAYTFTMFGLYYIFALIWFYWLICLFPIIKYMRSYIHYL